MLLARLIVGSMTSLSDRTIAALRAIHDELATVVSGLSQDQLAGGSGASEWSVAQVLSHLGSGAEISLANLRSAVAGTPAPPQDFNQRVWDRWNAMSPQDQASGFLASDSELVAALEELDAEQRTALRIELGFTPEPLTVASYAGMRLNEAAEHSWDVRVSLDPNAGISTDTAELLLEHFATGLAFLLGFTAKADALGRQAVVQLDDSDYKVVIADSVRLATSAPPATAVFRGPIEAAVRLLAGRLTTEYTPATVEVTGEVTLDDLRRVFPGY
jgi:uncharacterized protein (TIGR03083 family)